MGLAIRCLYRLTPRQFYNIFKGWQKQQDTQFRNGWEQTRFIAYASAAPHQKKGANLTPQKILPLPWDKDQENAGSFEQRDPEQEKALLKEAEEFYKKQDKKTTTKTQF